MLQDDLRSYIGLAPVVVRPLGALCVWHLPTYRAASSHSDHVGVAEELVGLRGHDGQEVCVPIPHDPRVDAEGPRHRREDLDPLIPHGVPANHSPHRLRCVTHLPDLLSRVGRVQRGDDFGNPLGDDPLRIFCGPPDGLQLVRTGVCRPRAAERNSALQKGKGDA
eukprot:6388752-Prymnesium_polylepis.1